MKGGCYHRFTQIMNIFSSVTFLPRALFLSLACFTAFLTQPIRAAETYVPPVTHRADVVLDSGWRFIREDVTNAETTRFDDSAWTAVTLPHTWNNQDGQDGGDNYHRGQGWYRLHLTPDAQYKGREFFLKFDGAFSVTEVWVNGRQVGRHEGGFAAFAFDVTPHLKAGGDNVIAVRVNNASNPGIPPLSADFTFFGGLYRKVHLLVTDPVQISPLDYGSPGVYLKTTAVSTRSAQLQVMTVLSNASPATANVELHSVIVDADANIVTVLTNVVTLLASSSSNVVARTGIDHPHLWDARDDPYLYHCYVEVWSGSQPVDVVAQPLGFRWFSVDPDKGFFLNGRHYDLHGVSFHQDWLDKGWAINEDDTRTNFALVREIGATAVRLSHYEHSDFTYQMADEQGVVLWSEIPLINHITESPGFYANAKQQLRELIRQRYNHPSVVCWGIYNEITLKPGPETTNLVSQLAQLAAEEDPTHPSVCAVAGKDDQPSAWYSQIVAFNKYGGWYGGKLSDFAKWADRIHANYPTHSIGVSEFGAGANIRQHSEDPVKQPEPGGKFHPEEYQNLFHETYWQALKQRPYLWCKFIWCLNDFANDARKEGDAPGRNDKGLVTYDRQVRKDAFYWYKANWNTNPMVYITGHTFTERQTNAITAKVYGNCQSVELFVNGCFPQGMRQSKNCIYKWPVKITDRRQHRGAGRGPGGWQ